MEAIAKEGIKGFNMGVGWESQDLQQVEQLENKT